MALLVFQASSLSWSSSIDIREPSAKAADWKIFCSQLRSLEVERTHLRFKNPFQTLHFKKTSMEYSRRNRTVRMKVVIESPSLAQDVIDDNRKVAEVSDRFKELRHRFLSFKEDIYLRNLEHYQRLSEAQAPKFMVIACADSRVCPSSILGFQPGEAFVVRNVANLVPPHDTGVSETNAALEFAVNSLEVENILIMGHSCCGGIRALMSLQDEVISSFTKSWVVIGKHAKSKTKAVASNLDFDQQCRHCEKESINRSMLNLLTYPWIEERAKNGTLLIHGGYYDFIDCTFEKWTLDYKADKDCSIKNREFWS